MGKSNLSSIVNALANAYGMQAELSSAYKGIFIDHIDQTCESDCAFIQRLATEYGGSVKISGGKLLFIDPYTGQFPDGTPLPKIQVGELSDFSLRITERNKYGRVVAKYYDFDAGKKKRLRLVIKARHTLFEKHLIAKFKQRVEQMPSWQICVQVYIP